MPPKIRFASCSLSLLWRIHIGIICLFLTTSQTSRKASTSLQEDTPVILNLPEYPYVFELNPGESHLIRRNFASKIIERRVEVKWVKTFVEPNYWFTDTLPRQNYTRAEVAISVSGKDTVLLLRPYQMPVEVNGLRVYVEAIKEWAENAQIADLKDLKKQVRLAIKAAGEPWGPAGLRFPIAHYRWRSAAYNNTWSSLVPYNLLYYHRGEDYGAIPDKLDVLAPFDGTITQTPLPKGDGKSNAIYIRNTSGIICRMAHMNIETIVPQYTVGTSVRAGTVLARTGMTWDGRKSQTHDPHCHVEFNTESTKLASFPYLMEAYFRDYPDAVLAVAGGYQFMVANQEVVLDATRSLARPGKKIASYQWRLHNGEVSNSAITSISYLQPGLYSEELIVTTIDGEQDHDFLQVRVFDKSKGRNITFGWAYYYPVRNISPGTEVLFWNRLVNTTSQVIVDFGDGSPRIDIDKEALHTYASKGIYTVTLSSTGPQGEPVTLKMEVHVE